MDRTCGECIHCDQLTYGTKRYCDVRDKYVRALGHIHCAAYRSVWEKDLFGCTIYEKMKAEKLAK